MFIHFHKGTLMDFVNFDQTQNPHWTDPTPTAQRHGTGEMALARRMRLGCKGGYGLCGFKVNEA